MGNENLVHRRFEYWVRRQPDALAVVDGDTRLTYAQLDALASTLAARLVEQGVAIEDPVAVQMARGYRVVVSFLAILKAGGCYVPVDPDYPAARQDFMKDDCGAVRTLTDADVDAAGQAARRTPPPRDLTGANLAYIVYTSGSTGRPKGVMVEHRNVCALMDEPLLGVGPGERVAQNVSISFDVAAFEIWGALCHGGCLVVMSSGRSVKELATEIRSVRPDWMFLTAGVFHLMVEHDPDALSAIGVLQAGGDVLGPAQFCRAAVEPRRGLLNAYGPSETTVYSGLYQAVPGQRLESVPIGSAPRGEHMVIAGDAPDGMGEILIGGAGVSRGYHRRPRLTAERFVPDPDAATPGGRRYRTGDLGSVAPDGSFLIHGRVDRQVKIRGFRIELPEIENVLVAHPNVGQAAVKVFHVGAEKRLGAFVAPAGTSPVSSPAVMGWLRERLPAYMLPTYLRVLDEIPLDPNGKVDRAALPYPWARRAEMDDLDPYAEPTTPMEKHLSMVWADNLQIDEVGRHDNYFLLGGDSLRVISLLAQLGEAGYPITAEEFLGNQTVAELAEFLEQWPADGDQPAGVAAGDGGTALP
ncbi:non-ribosomal peptide synthetase [Micromonospora sp. DT31]|uniref:non-ribosomal peptide synthetase n=1 Tax=Micromonospora sp. DT31 TaxID=3393434 RepID=UPI003CEB1FDB